MSISLVVYRLEVGVGSLTFPEYLNYTVFDQSEEPEEREDQSEEGEEREDQSEEAEVKFDQSEAAEREDQSEEAEVKLDQSEKAEVDIDQSKKAVVGINQSKKAVVGIDQSEEAALEIDQSEEAEVGIDQSGERDYGEYRGHRQLVTYQIITLKDEHLNVDVRVMEEQGNNTDTHRVSLEGEKLSSKVEKLSSKGEKLSPNVEKLSPNVEKLSPKVEKLSSEAQKLPAKVEKPSELVDNSSPNVDNPSPKVEKPSPMVEKPSPKVEKPSPKVDKPSPKLEKDEMLEFVSGNPNVDITHGILHLYKENELTSVKDEVRRSEMICLLAVPSKFTASDLLTFTAPVASDITHLRIVKPSSSGGTNQYMVLVRFRNQEYADSFYKAYNGVPFNSLEDDLCHLVYVSKVEVKWETDGGCLPAVGLTELPQCNICLERMDESVDGILTILCNHTFHTHCLERWEDSTCPVCRYCQTPEPEQCQTCSKCDKHDDLWICLICGHVGCGRYATRHAYNHFQVWVTLMFPIIRM